MSIQQGYISWFEKYRPRTIDELVFPTTLNGEKKDPQYIKDIFTKFYNEEFIRGNVLSYGKGGYGKTSLNRILQGKIIKHPRDIFILDRKIESVDKLEIWLNQTSVKSNQKLVVIEEFDRLSQQAQTVLKNGLMERYQDKVSFLATTNRAEKLDAALVTRFNYRLYFEEFDLQSVINRMAWILNQEKIEFNQEDLNSFCSIYVKRGLREMISNLEINSITGKFIFDVNKALNISGNEDYLIGIIDYLITYLKGLPLENVEKIHKNTATDEHFYQYYYYLNDILRKDLLLNFDFMYENLIEKENIDFGIKNILIQDYQIIDTVKMRNFHMLSTMSKIINDILQRKRLV